MTAATHPPASLARGRDWLFLLAGALALAACSSEAEQAAATGTAEPTESRIIGISPEQFQCGDLVPLAELASLLGGQVVAVETHFEPPAGMPRPCAYLRTYGESQEPWSYDLDCRRDAIENARELMKQYRASAASRAAPQAEAAKAQKSQAKGKKGSAKPAQEAAESPAPSVASAVDVEVGREALDHHGQSLIFIDDDAPCLARIHGPNAKGRLALARAIAKRLAPKNAPTGPRYRK